MDVTETGWDCVDNSATGTLAVFGAQLVPRPNSSITGAFAIETTLDKAKA